MTVMLASTESERGGGGEYPPGGKQNYGAGGNYRVGRSDTEESTADRSKWSGEEMEDSASEEESKTTGGGGEVGITPTPTTEGPEGSDAKTGTGVQRPVEALYQM